jgi:uncharacterized protein YndB with AHSA1/START domain
MSTTTRSVDAIVQEITIKAPATRVFEALIDPVQRMKWWGQKGRFETTNAESDLRPGGHAGFVKHNKLPMEGDDCIVCYLR